MNLIDLVKRFRKGIILAVTLVIIENLAWIVEPTLFGNVIDAVIDRASDPKSPVFLPLIFWVAAFVINSGVGVIRRSIDPKIFLNIFTQLATDVSRVALKDKLSASKTTARAELSYQYINFFQYRVPEFIENFIAIGGAIVAMYLIDWRISLTCLCIIFPLILISRLYNVKVVKLQKDYHDIYEDMYDVYSNKDPQYVQDYFQRLSVPQKKIANWGSFNFGFMRVSLLVIFLVVLHIAIDLDDFSAGDLYSIVAYLWTFVTAAEYLPELMESITAILDISKRLKSAAV